MHRRNALSLIGLAAIIPAAAFGKDRLTKEERSDQAEEKYIQETLEVGVISLATSRLASDRGKNRWIKKFAEYEIGEQESISALFASWGNRAPLEVRQERRDATSDLRDLLNDRFDEAYLEMQADGHEHLLRIQDEFIKRGPADDIGRVAKLIRSRVKEHVDLIRSIRDQLRA